MFWKVGRAFDECLIDDELGRNVGKLRFAPARHLVYHRLEIALHLGNADLERVEKIEVFRVLGQHRREIA